MVVILMGVSGSGKTTLGTLLSQRTGWPFWDADDLHPEGNRAKMSRGLPLNDRDREPWLLALEGRIRDEGGKGTFLLACSALKERYRERLSGAGPVRWVYLKGSRDLIASRLAARKGHFLDPSLLESQFGDLEEPGDALEADIAGEPGAIAEGILRDLEKEGLA